MGYTNVNANKAILVVRLFCVVGKVMMHGNMCFNFPINHIFTYQYKMV